MSCIKKIALTDPLIDSVTPHNLISDSCEILKIDLLKVKLNELDFVSRYKLKINKKDKFHAIVAWFDCVFSATDKKIVLSTSPFNKATHWKHTILYQPKP